MDRALLVDTLPASEQERGNAWAGRMFGLGSVTGFFVCAFHVHFAFGYLFVKLTHSNSGNVDLTQSLPFLGGTQLQILCGVASSLLIITHFITVFNVKERVLKKTTTG